MRSILAAIIFGLSVSAALGEEAYLLTGKAWAACVGTQMRYKHDPPERIAKVIDEKCGTLKEQEEEQFNSFLGAQVGKTFTAELAFTIMARNSVSPATLLPKMIEIYVSTMNRPPKQGAKGNPPLQLSR